MNYRAVAFDIDGTLYPSLGLYLRNLGFGLRHRRVLGHFSRVRHELHSLAMNETSRRDLPRDLGGFRSLQARLLAQRTGMGPDEARDWVERVMYGELEDFFDRIALFPGVVEALSAFERAGLRLAALSDFPAPRKLERIGLARFFEVAMSSEESGMLKPAPEPFLDLCGRLGLEPADVLYVGNSPLLDIAGAHGVGMDAALRGSVSVKRLLREPYTPRDHRPRQDRHPDLVFSDWKDLVTFTLG